MILICRRAVRIVKLVETIKQGPTLAFAAISKAY
jgi:hypothetical protein